MSVQSEFEAFLAERAALDAKLGTPAQAAAAFGISEPTVGAGPVPALANVAGDAIITNQGITVVNGAITVQNAGATVIIDGTSDMFKIAASGTVSVAWPVAAGNNPTGTVTLTGLAPAGALPAVMAVVAENIASGLRAAFRLSTDPSGHIIWTVQCQMSTTGTDDLQIAVEANAILGTLGAAVNAGARYYVLKEAGI